MTLHITIVFLIDIVDGYTLLKVGPLLSLRLVIRYHKTSTHVCFQVKVLEWISGLCSTTVPLVEKFSIRFMPKIVGFAHSWVHKSPKLYG